MQKSLIIESVDTNGVKKQKSIANINPEASNADCGEFAQLQPACFRCEEQIFFVKEEIFLCRKFSA